MIIDAGGRIDEVGHVEFLHLIPYNSKLVGQIISSYLITQICASLSEVRLHGHDPG